MIYPPVKSSLHRRMFSSRNKRRKKLRCLNYQSHYVSTPKKKMIARPILFRHSDSVIKQIQPKETHWHKACFESPDLTNPNFHKKFRKRFRMPYHCFISILEEISNHHLFPRWNTKNRIRRKRERSPLALLIMGTLRCLGRGWTFDDLEESAGMSSEVHRIFFRKHNKFERHVLFERCVKHPKNSAEAQSHTKEHEMAGLHGRIVSMDACHVTVETSLIG